MFEFLSGVLRLGKDKGIHGKKGVFAQAKGVFT